MTAWSTLSEKDHRAGQTLAISGLAHATHDGYTDLIYVLLPIWRTEFAVSYAMLALLRGLYTGVMAALQVPAGRLVEKFGSRFVLVCGTILAALGYAAAGVSGGIVGLCAALVLAGAGSSVQHPIASSAVSRAYGTKARGPLGTYNFTGDLGKAAIPALASVLLTIMPWRRVLWVIALIGLATAGAVAVFMPPIDYARAEAIGSATSTRRRAGFSLLFAIGMLDSAVRMGLLTFLPFLLKAKGASVPTVGFALALVFIGGAGGKFTCAWLGGRYGVLWTVLLTEGGTAGCIFALLALPLVPVLVLLPLLGVMLNGTSSVLYGTVPELAPARGAEHAFALFYTGVIGSGALAPVFYGFLGDAVGPRWATMATAGAALAIFPLAFALAPYLTPGRKRHGARDFDRE